MRINAIEQGVYAVIFTSQLQPENAGDYYEMAQKMVALAATMPGFIAMESSQRDSEYCGITVSYWRDLAAIKHWKEQSDHLLAQKIGKQNFYRCFRLEIAQIVKSYDFLHPSERS